MESTKNAIPAYLHTEAVHQLQDQILISESICKQLLSTKNTPFNTNHLINNANNLDCQNYVYGIAKFVNVD